MEEPDVTTADVDYDFFDEKVWPVMANRAKCFENLKVNNTFKKRHLKSRTTLFIKLDPIDPFGGLSNCASL